SARVGEELRLVADQAARRDVETEPRAPGAGGPHLDQLAAAARQRLDDDAGMRIVHIDDDFLDRLERHAVLLARHDPWLADRELEALAPHRLDQDAELQFAAPGNLERILVLALGYLQRDIA